MPSGMDSISPKMTLKWNLDAEEFIPEKYRRCYEVEKAKSSMAVQELCKVIDALTVEPAEFYELLIPLVSILEKEVNSENVLKAVVEVLLEKSVENVGFRYSGARMCSYLSQHLKLMIKGNFLQELVSRCSKEHDTILTGGGFQSLSHLIGFTLFMGELLMNMVEVKEIRSTFPSRLQELLVTLISHQSDEALLCVIQSLKLTGAKLDELVPTIEEVYLEIAMFIGCPNIPERIQAQLQGLLDLRGRGWEKNLNDTKETETSEEPSQDVSPDGMEPVYFDTNGHEYYFDEGETLENLKLSDENEENPYYIGDDPMDQETAKDFESFVAQLPLLGDDRVPDPVQPVAMQGYAPPDASWMPPDAACWPAQDALLGNNVQQLAPKFAQSGYLPFEFYEGMEPTDTGHFPPFQPSVPLHHQQQFTTAPLHSAGYTVPIGLHGNTVHGNELLSNGLPNNEYLASSYSVNNGMLGNGLQHNGWPGNAWMSNRPLNNGWQLSETLNNSWVGNETLNNSWQGNGPRTTLGTTASQFMTPSNGALPNAAPSYFRQ